MVVSIRKRIARARSSTELKAGAWYIIASFVQKGITFVTLPLFTALLSPEDFGTVAVFTGWMAALQVLVGLELKGAVFNANVDFDADGFKRFIASILTLGITVACGALLLFAVMPDSWLSDAFGLSKPLSMLMIVGAASNLPIEIALNVWRTRYEHRWFNATRIGVTLASTILAFGLIIGLPLVFAGVQRSTGQIFAIVGVNLAVGTGIGIRIMRQGRTGVNIAYWRYALAISPPLIIHSLSGIALNRIDRLMIDQFIGREETGVYTLVYNFGEIVSVLWFATNSVWIAWFYAQMKAENKPALRKRSVQYAVLFAVAVCGLMLVGPFVVRLLTPRAYWSAVPLLPVIMAGGYFTLLYSLYAGIESYYKQTRYIAAATLAAAALNVGLNAWLLPIYGYPIAAWTTIAAYLCLYLVHSYVVIFRLKMTDVFRFWPLTMCGAGVAAFSVLVFIWQSRLG